MSEDEIGHVVGVIEPQVLIDRTSGAITEEPNRTSGSTFSDSSSPYSSDFDRAEPPAAASPGHSSLEEEEGEEGSAAPRPAGADEGDKALAYIPNLGNDRPVLPDDGLHWFVDTTDGSYRPAVGRSRPKRGEILYDGTKDDLLEEYGNLTGPAGAPAAEPFPARNRPQSGEYDNTFWYGLGKDGQPYFSRATGDRRKRIKSDVGKVSWTEEEPKRFFGLQKRDRQAWLEYRWELYRQLTGGQEPQGSEDDDVEAPGTEPITMADYEQNEKLMRLANELACCSNWSAIQVRHLLLMCEKQQNAPGTVICKIREQIRIQAA